MSTSNGAILHDFIFKIMKISLVLLGLFSSSFVHIRWRELLNGLRGGKLLGIKEKFPSSGVSRCRGNKTIFPDRVVLTFHGPVDYYYH